jgi:hypothetical protein
MVALLIVSAIGLVITIAATAWQLYQQSQQTAQQNKYQQRLAENRDKQIEDNYELSVASANQQYRQLQNRQQQESEAASQKEIQASREGAQARSTARLAAGEAGVSGLSVNALLQDFMGQEARYRDAVKTNAGYANDQLREEMKGVEAQASGRIASITPYIKQPVDRPNYIGGALRVGGAALDAYTRYSSGLSSGGDSGTSSTPWAAGYGTPATLNAM